MGETVENNSVNSCSYEDYSDAGLSYSSALVSRPAEPAVDLTAARPDNYSEPLRLPTHLSAHDNIRITDGQGQARTLELIELVRESRNDAAARRQLLSLAQAAASDPRVHSSCFIGSEDNLLPILAQLASEDPIARREGALSLKELIQSKPEDRRLQQGLLATVDQIAQDNPRNQEARELLVSLYQDRSPQNAGLRQWMQSHTAVSSYATVATNANTNVTPGRALATTVGGGGSTLPLLASDSSRPASAPASASGATPLSPSQVLALPGFAPLANLIQERTQGTPLQGLPLEGVVGFALTHNSLPAAQFQDLLYLRIMASALPLNGFTGNLFGQSMIVAGNLAQDIRRHLDGAPQVAGAVSRGAGESAVETGSDPTGTPTLTGPAPAPSASPTLERSISPSLFASQTVSQGGFATGFNFFVPSLLTSLAGMQALAYQPTALGPNALTGQALGFANRSSYHVDGPTALDEDSHQGFGGDSQGQGGGQDQEGHEDSSQAQDTYYA